MKIFHIDASSKFHQWSNSRLLGKYFLERLHEKQPQIIIDYIDVTEDVQPHVTAEYAQAIYTLEAERTEQMRQVLKHSDAMCKRVLQADALVCAMPMYNWTIPSTFKTFIDCITRMGMTYDAKPGERSQGKLSDKKVLFITTRGADLRPGGLYEGMDAMTPVLKNSFLFLGIEEQKFVNAQPLQFADQAARVAALLRAKKELDQVAIEWSLST
ncbi:FMN-dependent NADH-azoreductase [Entomobacter blattae]|uniref:FMN dependent NADH:quinone oxidoreductase n=1 Tax=Entomobacter blattae TaxID=2762277 RepID=A0A7H1NTX3_9PROT|nr:NAD(P)H-dependent oxidoreductase [Entomobacter blattae]QNT79233.1 FMN-dependent NADH-azoreductase [Entomobacter blattae]